MELLHPSSRFSGTVSGNRRVWFYMGNFAERASKSAFPEALLCAWPCKEHNTCRLLPHALFPASYTYTTISFHTLSVFLRALSPLPHELHFLPHATIGSMLCDLAEAFDTTGHFLSSRMFFLLGFCAAKLSPHASQNPPSQPPSWNLLHFSPFDPSVPVVFRVPHTAHFFLLLSHLIPTSASMGNLLMNSKSRPFLNSRYIHPFA